MRFCMVTSFYPPYHFGGDATYVRSLARALVDEGHHVTVVHCEDAYRISGGRIRNQAEPNTQDGVRVIRLRSRLGVLSPIITQQTGHPGLKSKALRKILDDNFDVVNFHNISLVGGPGVLRLSRAPVTLYTLHEHWLLCPTHIFWKYRRRSCDRPDCLRCSIRSGLPPQLWRYTGLIKRSLVHVDALLTPSEYTARRHQEMELGTPIHVLPLFSTLDPGPSEPWSAPDRPRFVCVGRVTASKGIEDLVQLFAELPDYNLDIIGAGDLCQELSRQNQCGNIRFLGHVPQAELVSHYQQATALVLPSLAPESFGLTVLEAFACGTPAIVREAGASRELPERTGGGIVYSTQQELKAALRRLAEDPQWRHKLGENARAGFLAGYTRELHLERYMGFIDRLSHEKGTRLH